MIQSLVVAEFHDTEGAKCTLKYPSLLDDDQIALENYILPEGLHNFTQDSAVVLIRRKGKNKDFQGKTWFKRLSRIRFKVELYEYQDDWVEVSPTSELCFLSFSESNGKFFLVISSDMKKLQEIEIHSDLQFTILKEDFSSFYSLEGRAFGLHTSKNHIKELDRILHLMIEDPPCETESKVLSTELVYCLTVGSIQKSSSSQRGVKIMGLAVISPSKHVVQLDSLISIALTKLLERPERSSRILKRLYKTVNSVDWPSSDLPEPRIKLLRSCIDRGYQFESSKTINFSYDSLNIFTEINSLLLDDELIVPGLKKLFDIFQEKLIKIYNCLLQEKRVVIFARNKPCHLICNMTLAVASLISPPIPFILQEHVFPYVALSDLELLNSSFFVAGANNPLFRHREQWWDLLADLDTGEVLTSVSTPQILNDFMKNLMENLKFDPSPELLLRSQFFDFTRHVLDSKVHPNVFEMFQSKLPDIGSCGELSLKYLALKAKSEGNMCEDVFLALLKLRLMHITEKFEGIETVYKEILELLWNAENLEYFLAALPNCGDLHCVAAGFFIENTKVWRYACKILSLIEENVEGKFLVLQLQTNELNAYIAYKNRI